ncbi:S8 family serine peptidase [Alteromonas sp. H39]|uniref:S8 family serine peptidase n=1 Tax=Alteromonas sp. H39 TaxID=3389876 RepID=UPI0039E1C827
MRKSILSTVVVAALAGTTGAAFAFNQNISGHTVEQRDAVEAAFDKKALINDSIKVGNDQIRVIVQLQDVPMAQFAPINPMMRADIASKGQKVNFNSPSAKEYQSFLVKQQQSFIAAAKKIDKRFKADFTYSAAFNGVAGIVSKERVDALMKLPNVKAVYPDTIQHAQMDASLDIINAMDVWEKIGGRETAGAGIKVAIVDSGIRPENPLFSGEGFEAPAADTLPTDDYCSVAEDFCNNKLIVARHAVVPEGFSIVPEEYDSPLGFNGHGTHVAGTAVGNYGVTAERDGATAEISGVAPAAYLMVYKGLYATPANPASSSGSNSMLLSMLEASLMDGADIVNNSWGGGPGGSPSGSPYADVFEAMNDAGVVTVFAAGNDGPGPQTVGCPGCSDDVLTVAATTTDRLFANEVSIEGDDSIGSIPALHSGVVPVTEPITATVVFAGEIDEANVEGCEPFADGAFDDSIALISRGTCGFVTKIENAESAGATAVLIYNSAGNGEAPILMGGLSDEQTIPSLMLPFTPGSALAELAETTDEPVSITIGDEVIRTTSDSLADIMADFSSRGPNGDPRFLKPNLAAPGVRIFSGESPDAPGHVGENFSFKNGTSMAAPHVAGAAALIKQMHPDWSSMQIKSALVTSSIRDIVKEDAVRPADNFDMGAGRLDAERASTVELTYSDLSMVNGNCYLTCEMSITVTNTSDSEVSVSPTVMFNDSAIDASISPADATLPAGASAEITLSVDVSAADTNAWSFGGVNWSDTDESTTDYFIPVALYPISSDNPGLFYSMVSQQTASAGDVVENSAAISNQAVTGLISISGNIDEKFDINPATISAVKNGDQQPVTYDDETRTVYWEGALNTASFTMTADTVIGDLLAGFGLPRYTSMASLGVLPVTCSEVCDDTSIAINMPTVTYLGKEYSSMQISSNGYVSLGTSSGSTSTPYTHILPGLAEPNNVVAPFWADFDLDGTSDSDTGAGNIYAVSLTTGHFVVEWSGAELYGIPGSNYNFQLWFDYESGEVHYVYGDMDAASLADSPLGIVVGAENETGAVGTTHAAVTQSETIGALPATGDEFTLTSNAGDDIEISFAGAIKARTEYMDDLVTLEEDTSLTANVLSNDMDSTVINTFTMESLSGDFRTYTPIIIEASEIDTESLSVTNEPSNGSVVVNEDGSITYTPNADYFGEDSFTYTVMDENEEIVGEAVVNVMVEGVQDAPVLNINAPSSVDEGSSFTVTASATDADGDDVSIMINGIQQSSYTATAPGSDTADSVSVEVTATDGINTTTETVNIAVNDKSGGSMGWLALLLVPVAFLRRRKMH